LSANVETNPEITEITFYVILCHEYDVSSFYCTTASMNNGHSDTHVRHDINDSNWNQEQIVLYHSTTIRSELTRKPQALTKD
jgi:hypothetical protein